MKRITLTLLVLIGMLSIADAQIVNTVQLLIPTAMAKYKLVRR